MVFQIEYPGGLALVAREGVGGEEFLALCERVKPDVLALVLAGDPDCRRRLEARDVLAAYVEVLGRHGYTKVTPVAFAMPSHMVSESWRGDPDRMGPVVEKVQTFWGPALYERIREHDERAVLGVFY
jgi:hypothetical protein